MIKYILALLPSLFVTSQCFSDVLVTDSFIIEINSNCTESEESCNGVSYLGLRKSDGAVTELFGETLNKKDSLDVYGYRFTNGLYQYYIYIDSAELAIERDGLVLISQRGYWKRDYQNIADAK